MLRFDAGIIVDSTGDGGDSANRTGLLGLFDKAQPFEKFEVKPGLLVRHPTQSPWTNPWNFSRDQLVPFVAGAWKCGKQDLVKRVFWVHARRLFFCQNFERDVPGSTKYPWPHTFVNDKGEKETRSFDFADPLLPDAIWHLILCAELRWLYWFGLMGYPWLFLSLVIYCRFNTSNDDGQIISQCVRAGRFFVWLYKNMKPNWQAGLTEYWETDRQMGEMRDLIVRGIC